MKTINKNIIYLGWVSFFTDMASSIISILLPFFVVYVLHEGVDKLGVVIAVATFVSYGFRMLFGYLSDRFSMMKPFLIAGYALSALSKPLLAFSTTFISIALLRGVERMGKAIRSAPKDALISSYAVKKESGKSFGFHKMMDISGELVGAIIVVGVFLVVRHDETTIRTLFLFTLIPGVIALVILVFKVEEPTSSSKKIEHFNKADRKLFPILGFYFLFLFFMFSDQYLILKAMDAGFTLAQVPWFVILLTLTQALVSYYSGVLIDTKGSTFMLLLSFVFGTLSMVALRVDLIWLAFLFLGLFTVISLNAIRASISHEAQSIGTVFGIFYAGVALFAALGALLTGYLWEHLGFRTAVDVSIVGAILLTFWFGVYRYRS